MKNILINILAFGSLFSAVLVITSKNPVISVLFLIFTFVSAAAYLILNGIYFIGLSYIILYVGAIAVLFLFILMMLDIKLIDILETGKQYTKNIPLAVAIGSLFIYEIFTILPFTFNDVSFLSSLFYLLTYLNGIFLSNNVSSVSSVFLTYNPNISDTYFTNFSQIQSVGFNLYNYGAIFLIISSIILLLAMLAPILISAHSNNHSASSPASSPSQSSTNNLTPFFYWLGCLLFIITLYLFICG